MIDVVVVIWSLSVVIIMVKTTVDTHVAPGKKKGKKEGAEKDENEEDVFTNTVPRDFPEVRSPSSVRKSLWALSDALPTMSAHGDMNSKDAVR